MPLRVPPDMDHIPSMIAKTQGSVEVRCMDLYKRYDPRNP